MQDRGGVVGVGVGGAVTLLDGQGVLMGLLRLVEAARYLPVMPGSLRAGTGSGACGP